MVERLSEVEQEAPPEGIHLQTRIGNSDVYRHCRPSSPESAASAASLVVTANGAVSVKTSALLTPEVLEQCQTPGT